MKNEGKAPQQHIQAIVKNYVQWKDHRPVNKSKGVQDEAHDDQGWRVRRGRVQLRALSKRGGGLCRIAMFSTQETVQPDFRQKSLQGFPKGHSNIKNPEKPVVSKTLTKVTKKKKCGRALGFFPKLSGFPGRPDKKFFSGRCSHKKTNGQDPKNTPAPPSFQRRSTRIRWKLLVKTFKTSGNYGEAGVHPLCAKI